MKTSVARARGAKLRALNQGRRPTWLVTHVAGRGARVLAAGGRRLAVSRAAVVVWTGAGAFGFAVATTAQPPAGGPLAPSDGAVYAVTRGRDTLAVETVQWWGDTRILAEIRVLPDGSSPGARVRYGAELQPDTASKGPPTVKRLRLAIWDVGPDATGRAPRQEAVTTFAGGWAETRVAVPGRVQVQRAVAGDGALPYIAHYVGLLDLIARSAQRKSVPIVWIATAEARLDTVRVLERTARAEYDSVLTLRLSDNLWYVGLDASGRLRAPIVPQLGIAVARTARLQDAPALLPSGDR